MKPILPLLLLVPLFAQAAPPPSAEAFVSTAKAIAAPDWAGAVAHKASTGSENLRLLIPFRLGFSPSGVISAKGHSLFELADAYARRFGKKLYMEVSDEIPANGLAELSATLPDSHVTLNALLGSHVYLYTKD